VDAGGKKAKDTRTLAQKAALIGLLCNLKALYPKAKIMGHRDYSSKACPSFDAKAEYRTL
jgi:N-acetylmuramoyl-L-alanine amidase